MGSWCQKSLLKSLFYFNFLSSIYWKKLQNHTSLSSLPNQGFSGLIRFCSVARPPISAQIANIAADSFRKMHNILRARFRFTYALSNAAQNAQTQSWKQMHSMVAVNEQKLMPGHRASNENIFLKFVISFLLFMHVYIFLFPSNQHFKAFLVSKINSETSFLY